MDFDAGRKKRLIHLRESTGAPCTRLFTQDGFPIEKRLIHFFTGCGHFFAFGEGAPTFVCAT
jgi:hypothetical protein